MELIEYGSAGGLGFRDCNILHLALVGKYVSRFMNLRMPADSYPGWSAARIILKVPGIFRVVDEIAALFFVSGSEFDLKIVDGRWVCFPKPRVSG